MGDAFRRAGEQVIEGLAAGLYQSAIEIMRTSQGEVPVEFAILKASGRVLEPVLEGTTLVCTLGYGYGTEVNPRDGKTAAGYAIPVHERLELKHAPPTKAKYLEDPVLAFIKDYEPTLAASIVRAQRGGAPRFGNILRRLGGREPARGGLITHLEDIA